VTRLYQNCIKYKKKRKKKKKRQKGKTCTLDCILTVIKYYYNKVKI